MDIETINAAIKCHYKRKMAVKCVKISARLNWIALRWENFYDIYVNYFHLRRIAKFILRRFADVDAVFISGSMFTRRSLGIE